MRKSFRDINIDHKILFYQKNLKPSNDSFVDSYAGETPARVLRKPGKFRDLFKYAKELNRCTDYWSLCFKSSTNGHANCTELKIKKEIKVIFVADQEQQLS